MRRPTVGFQGELGAFSQQAVQQFFGEAARVVPFVRFQDVFRALTAEEIHAAVIPVENTLHGSVHENYDHLLTYDVRIVGETSVRIVHNLIAAPGVRLRDVRRVFSHPVALNQCLKFLSSHPTMEQVPFYDTAGSVKMVMADQLTDAAAIGSAVAASIYQGHILRRSVEDDRRNFTRFVLLNAKRRVVPTRTPIKRWKTSLVFATRNIPGALFRSLSTFALRDLNLIKIESRPLRGKPWEYMFYLDVIGREEDVPVKNALRHLAELADFLRVLGTYPSES
jgi:prephenate dehydratase